MDRGPRTDLGGRLLTCGSINGKALSSEQTCVNRPRPRAEHRKANGEDRQEDVNPQLLAPREGERQSEPQLVESNQRSHRRGPQATEQKDAGYRGYQALCEADRFRGVQEAWNTETD